MAILRNNGGSYGALKSVLRNTGGTWSPAKAVWRNVGGNWQIVWNARTVTIIVQSSTRVRSGSVSQGRYYDQIVFRILVSDGAGPTSYSWYGDASGTGATVTFNGPIYQLNGFNYQASGTVYCSVVVGGQTFTPSYYFTYTAGDIA